MAGSWRGWMQGGCDASITRDVVFTNEALAGPCPCADRRARPGHARRVVRRRRSLVRPLDRPNGESAKLSCAAGAGLEGSLGWRARLAHQAPCRCTRASGPHHRAEHGLGRRGKRRVRPHRSPMDLAGVCAQVPSLRQPPGVGHGREPFTRLRRDELIAGHAHRARTSPSTLTTSPRAPSTRGLPLAGSRVHGVRGSPPGVSVERATNPTRSHEQGCELMVASSAWLAVRTAGTIDL